MDQEKIKIIKKRMAGVTPGSWTAGTIVNYLFWRDPTAPVLPNDARWFPISGVPGLFMREADAEFIAAAREDIKALLVEIEHLKARTGILHE